MGLFVSDIIIYPVKSLAGIRLQKSNVEIRGLQYDRRWMVVDEAGRFLSQREHSGMALIGTAFKQDSLILFDSARPDNSVVVPLGLSEEATEKAGVQVWSSRLKAFWRESEVDGWLSERLGQRVRLVQLPDTSKRATDRRYAPAGQYIRFVDAFPYLLIGSASLLELNNRLGTPVGVDRFRPNLVVNSHVPFEEDNWSEVWIGDCAFKAVKSCARCVMVTIDQQSAKKDPEILKALGQFRRNGNKVLFGQYLIWTGLGGIAQISVGDKVEVSTLKE